MTAGLTDALRERFGQVRLLALDVDGVLTDGGLYYSSDGKELRRFDVKDGMGLLLLMQAGVSVAIISAGRGPVTLHRARDLGIAHVFVEVKDKLATLSSLCQTLDITLAEVAFVGDDLNDLPVLQVVGLPLTVADALAANQTIAAYVTRRSGGHGAVREICDMIMAAQFYDGGL